MHLQRAAIGLWPARAPESPLKIAAQALLRQVTAVLSFDSWASPALSMGVRSLRSPTRHLLFSAMGRDIDLRITETGGAYSLTGQILGPDDSGLVELMRHDEEAASTHVAPLDALGEFRIGGLQGGTYVLTLRLSAEQIVLPSVLLGTPPDESGG
jgi:hypothetical protein